MAKNFKKHVAQILSGYRFIYKFSSGKNLYLTFDDGPHERYTRQILNILSGFSVKSTFFLVGKNVELHPQIVSEIKNSGHAIGLHTYSHKRLDIMSKKDFKEEIILNQQAIEQVIGEKPFMIRPPLGRMNLANMIWAKSEGLRIIHFTITSSDWKANNVFDVLKAVDVEEINGGEIIAFHDNNRYTVEALPFLLKKLLGNGYSCAPIVLDSA